MSKLTQANSANISSNPSTNPKLVRDTFSMPDSDYQLIAEILQRFPALQARTTKSELVRAGIRTLYEMDDTDLQSVLTKLERLKTGRPAKKSII